MADKKSPATQPVQIDAAIVAQIRVIVGHTGQSASELLSPILREPIAREYERVVLGAAKKLEEQKKQQKNHK